MPLYQCYVQWQKERVIIKQEINKRWETQELQQKMGHRQMMENMSFILL